MHSTSINLVGGGVSGAKESEGWGRKVAFSRSHSWKLIEADPERLEFPALSPRNEELARGCPGDSDEQSRQP